MEVGYGASVAWYIRYLRSLLEGTPSPAPEKHPNRCLVAPDEGAAGQWLTIPVEGSGHRSRDYAPSRLRISDHGRWRQVHAGALQACYGKAPYYDEYWPRLSEILRSDEVNLGRFNLAIHRWVVEEVLHLPELLGSLREKGSFPESEAWHFARPELSIFHLAFHKGPEGALTLIN